MMDKIFLEYCWHVPFTMLDEDWKALEHASGLEFSKDHRSSIESAINEYLANKCAMSHASTPKAVGAVLDRIGGLASDLYMELMLLQILLMDEKLVTDSEALANQRRVAAYAQKKYKKSHSNPAGSLGDVVSSFIRTSAKKVNESEDVVYETRKALDPLNTVLEYARHNLPKGGGSPGDPYLDDMLSKVSLVFSQAGGGRGYSSEAMTFWREIRKLIRRYFDEHEEVIPRDAMPALTDAAIKTRLIKINRRKGAD